MTLIQAQQRYIDRVNSCHAGHRARVSRSAWTQLFNWALSRGFDEVESKHICLQARDVANLERNAED